MSARAPWFERLLLLTLGTMFLLIGASLVPIGILDHLLLVKLMREVRESQNAERAGISRRVTPGILHLSTSRSRQRVPPQHLTVHDHRVDGIERRR